MMIDYTFLGKLLGLLQEKIMTLNRSGTISKVFQETLEWIQSTFSNKEEIKRAITLE